MNRKTLALTKDDYERIIKCIREGFLSKSGIQIKPNHRIATALVLEANLGLRISDILNLHVNDIVNDGGRYRLNITEQKTDKSRTFSVPAEIYNYILGYALDNKIDRKARLFPITERSIQKHLKTTCDHLEINGIGTHSFRKYFATEIYNENGFNIELVRILLQHSTTAITQKYLGIQPKQIEDALNKHINLL